MAYKNWENGRKVQIEVIEIIIDVFEFRFEYMKNETASLKCLIL